MQERTATIEEQKPELVFAAHVETAAGMMIPDDYLKRLTEAVHAAGGLMVLDGTLALDGVTLTDSTAATDGGAVYLATPNTTDASCGIHNLNVSDLLSYAFIIMFISFCFTV